VSTLLIDRLPGAETLAIDRDALRELTEAALKSNSGFLYRPTGKEGNALRLSIGSDGAGQVYVGLEYERSDDSEPVLAERFLKYKNKDDLKTSLRSALAENLKEIHEQVVKIVQKEGAIQTLQAYAADRNVREGDVIDALEQVSDTKDKEAVKPVVACLKSGNIRIALRAVETLGVLKDPTSVDAITEFAERKVPEIRRHAIEAVRKIGGKSAAAWLFTLSTGHPDEKVRAASMEAFREVEAALKKG